MKFIKRKGFTLIEIAVVIIVIGVLIAGISQAMEMFAEASLKSARNLSKSSRIGRVNDLTIWFDATSEKAFDKEKDDGSAVSIWKDSNPRSTIIISSTSSLASLYPSYTLSAINSLPAVSFKKTSALVGNCVTVPNESFINNSEDFTLYLIYSPKTLDDGIILEKNNASVTTFPFSLELLSGSYKFSVKNSTSTISVTSPKQAIIKTPNLIRLSRIKGSQIEIIIDGVSTTETDTLTSSTLNNAELSIGCRNGSTPANFISGDFGETAFFNRNVNVKEKADIEEYLYKKWKMKKFEGTLPANCSVTGGAGYSAKTLLPIGSASFSCDTGYTGTISYTCPSSGGTATITSGSCTMPITCTVPNANTNSDGASVNLTTTATSLTCKTGFFGSPTYTCTGTGTYLAGGIPCAPIKCYANDMTGFRGTNYFDNVSAGVERIFVYSTFPTSIYHENTSNSPYLLLLDRLKLFDVYHGPLTFQSKSSWYIYKFNPIDRSQFSKTSYPSYFSYQADTPPDDYWDVRGTHTFTKYARILSYGTNTFTCDSGFTGTLTYNCTVDGSTLNPTSGTCN